MNDNLDYFLKQELADLKSKNLYRELKLKNIKLIDFSSNDYLGLAGERNPHATLRTGSADETLRVGSSGSRLLTGTHRIHLEVEEFISKWKQAEAAMIFTSGYLANLGAISALMNSRDLVFTDELNHACIFDGIRLSKAKKFIYKHNDMEHLAELLEKNRSEHGKAMIITDTVFSMDGDRAKLADIVELSKRYNAFIYVDEAHALGVLGETGAGLVEELVNRKQISYQDITVQMGTFSKAVGVEGAYIVGSRDLINYLSNKARTFVYSTSASPLILNRVLNNLKELSTNSKLRNKLKENIEYFQKNLEGEIDFINERTAIFSIFIGDLEETLKAALELQEAGFLIMAIRAPTVSSPRLRICISAKHSQQELDKLLHHLT